MTDERGDGMSVIARDLPDDARWITVRVSLPPTLDVSDVRDELRGTAFAVEEVEPATTPGAVERAEKAEARVKELLGVLRVLRSGLPSDDDRIDVIDRARGQ
jgi:hypothetical protein